MKLDMHPVSTASRPILLMIAEHDLPVELNVIDVMKGEHTQPPYSDKNPNKLVPLLEDGDFHLTESSTILKYLAGKFDLPVYPKGLQQRAKVDEMMDWFNTQLVRDFLYNLHYPQLFDHHRRPSDEAQAKTLDWGKQNAGNWLTVLDQHWLGPDKQFLCGDEVTIADYFGACILAVGEVTRCDLSAYPNIRRWFANVKQLEHWSSANEALYGFAGMVKDKPFVAIG